jgi:hypothetical protein
MKGFSTTKAVVAVVAFVAALGLLRYKPWAREAAATHEATGAAGEAREKLTVGFLPVT